MRYIEIDSIIEKIKAEHCDRCKHDERCALCDIDDALLMLEEADDADVEEVKHGKWKQTEEPLGWQDVNCIECSACGESWIMDDDLSLDEYVESWKYCPNCGAKMVGERKEK